MKLFCVGFIIHQMLNHTVIVLILNSVTQRYILLLLCFQEDVFTVTCVDLGLLKKLRIRHDNSHAHSSWYLDRVEIVDTRDDTT